jgi:hypothetical protein
MAARKAENLNLKAHLTKPEILLSHAIRTGIALSAVTLSMSTAYLIHPYTVLDVGKTMVRIIDKTVHIPIEAYNEYTVRKAADEAAKQALIAQHEAEEKENE